MKHTLAVKLITKNDTHQFLSHYIEKNKPYGQA